MTQKPNPLNRTGNKTFLKGADPEPPDVFSTANDRALGNMDDFMDWLDLKTRCQGKEIQFLNPKRDDNDFGSASINSETGTWADFADEEAKGGDCVSFVAYLRDLSQVEAANLIIQEFSGSAPPPAPPAQQATRAPNEEAPLLPIPPNAPPIPQRFGKGLGSPSKTFTYRNAEGGTLGHILRFDPPGGGKTIRPLTLWETNGTLQWKIKGFPVPHPLYNLDQLAARPDDPVLVVEGEKSADAAKDLFPDYVVTTAMHGAKSVGKADLSPLLGRKILVWPDNDKPGQRYAREIGEALLKQDKLTNVTVMKPLAYLPELCEDDQLKPLTDPLPQGFDAADALALGWTAELLALVPAEDLYKPPMMSGTASRATGMPEDVAAIVHDHFGGNIMFVNGSFLGYEHGAWSALDEMAEVSGVIARHFGKNADTGIVFGTLGLVKVFQARKYEDSTPDLNLICLNNGTLNTSTYELLDHRPEHHLRCKLSVQWDPEAQCPRWLQFLDDVFVCDADKAQKILFVQEWFGYCLTPDNSQHKFVWMVGSGGNGKSVLLTTLTHLVGRSNVSNAHIERLGDKFVRAELEDKLINISAEMSANATLSDGYLKSIVAGDEIEAERKFKPSFSFRPYVRLIGATNHLPRLRDLSEGFFRRAIILGFNRQFSETEQDHALEAKLDAELPGILVWALNGLKSLRNRGRLGIPPSSVATLNQYRHESDTEKMFIEECLLISTDNSGRTSPSELYEIYTAWCRSNGYMARNKVNFGKRLAELGIEKHRSGGKDYWCVGILSDDLPYHCGYPSLGSMGIPLGNSPAEGSGYARQFDM
ncbi:MAG: hypothetical protein GJU73_10830 [Ferrovum sp.]|jgi:putative DNA primase/helicase|uniref:phage/plasmid primase, P4 family n=1 Tax=Ferrovum sp. TaxID=2609467 RepID=UPI002624115E|nr:phage/plasmid primase, P4 family [Ferrovum sp.]MBW8067919.1 hypothetical protein [Ferrovum sp.]